MNYHTSIEGFEQMRLRREISAQCIADMMSGRNRYDERVLALHVESYLDYNDRINGIKDEWSNN